MYDICYIFSMEQERLKQLLDYDPETGIFKWRVRRQRIFIGRVAGNRAIKGYLFLAFDGKTYQCHRLAWFYVYGEWPKYQIDHINGIRDDNRIANLRLATPSQNLQNRPAPSSNTSGFKGVAWHKGARKWQAYISLNSKRMYLGLFSTKEDAYSAYCTAAIKHHGEFANTNC
jgi:hypothetical protein